eukprot:494789_1
MAMPMRNINTNVNVTKEMYDNNQTKGSASYGQNMEQNSVNMNAKFVENVNVARPMNVTKGMYDNNPKAFPIGTKGNVSGYGNEMYNDALPMHVTKGTNMGYTIQETKSRLSSYNDSMEHKNGMYNYNNVLPMNVTSGRYNTQGSLNSNHSVVKKAYPMNITKCNLHSEYQNINMKQQNALPMKTNVTKGDNIMRGTKDSLSEYNKPYVIDVTQGSLSSNSNMVRNAYPNPMKSTKGNLSENMEQMKALPMQNVTKGGNNAYPMTVTQGNVTKGDFNNI